MNRCGPVLLPKTLQTFAGHASLQITTDRYGHLFRSESHGQAMDAIADSIDSPVRLPQPPNLHRK